MAEPVQWLPDGTPRSPRFGDIYRSQSGGLAQARHVFLQGCGLPQAWRGRRQWRVLETGFGLGLNFLACWQAWKDDGERPAMLHFASCEAWPVGAEDLLRAAHGHPELMELARSLAAQWFGLTPGVHRLVFEQGRVLLTLFIGDVRDALHQEPFAADCVFLDGFDPEINPRMWEPTVLKAVARHCAKGAALATWTVAGDVKRALKETGFQVEKVPGLAPKRECLRTVFAPAWEPRGDAPPAQVEPSTAVVIGAGIAGSAAAASLARRGWQVTVLDGAAAPAAGASSLPAGLLAPHFSSDDGLLSRLSRSGVRVTLQQARALLREGIDWAPTGALEVRSRVDGAPEGEGEALAPWSRVASHAQLEAAGLAAETAALWHEQAAWIQPAALVRAWLSETGVAWQGNAQVERLVRDGNDWVLHGPHGEKLARAPLVVVAAALGSAALLGDAVSLRPVRGQVSWALRGAEALPPFPLNGNGHFIPDVPHGAARAWFSGSTFDAGETSLVPRNDDHAFNLERLHGLAPQAAQQVAPVFAAGAVQAWTGVRCASQDRRPLLGEIQPGLWVNTAMGSRGLTFAALCGELLAARLHGEPLPLERKLAQALRATR